MKAKINLLNIKSYLVGKFRYRVYYSYFCFLIRKHIQEQIDWRVKVMDQECYDKGSCILCGCETTALQMANKTCDKPCYPTMMKRYHWWIFKKGGIMYDYTLDTFWQIVDGNLIKFKTIKERQSELERNT